MNTKQHDRAYKNWKETIMTIDDRDTYKHFTLQLDIIKLGKL